MSNADAKPTAQRTASLSLVRTADGPTISARVPGNLGRQELARVTDAAYELVAKLTGCQCLSGQYRFVVEDLPLADVTHVILHG